MLRKDVPHLLDIDGDVCHHIHNASKMFCKHFNHDVEQLVDDFHTEYKYSTDLRQWLQQVCEILQCSYHMPKQRVPHRWMSVLDVLEPSVPMIDAFTLLYWAWLPSKDKPNYQEVINEILNPLSTKEKAVIARIVQQCKLKKLTSDGTARKIRIVEHLFYKRRQTLVYIHLYLSVLPVFKSFILSFEQRAPMAHRLHEEQMSILQHLLCSFIKHELVKGVGPKQLRALDLEAADNQQSLDSIFVGQEVRKLLSQRTMLPSTFRVDFLRTLRKAYQETAKYLLHKLPITNPLLICLGATDPVAVCAGHSVTAKCLKRLV